ncbi:MAG TPA: phage major capsid protein, partial [Methylotenera sp.]|nr:phage major capsid protein [Methylotenera sp.]
NSGSSKITSLAKARIKNALRTFNNNFSSDMYSAGTLTNQVNGLQAIIADTNTNTVGGIDANTWSFWRNNVIDASVLGVTTSATTIESGLMLPAWLATDRGPDDQTDLIVMDNNYYKFFEGSQLSLKRYSDSSKADAGFVTMKYKNADVLYDGNSGIPSNHAYFINTNYLELVTHKDADLEIMDEMRPVNQDGAVVQILWMGNLVCSNRKQQAVIIE